MEPLSIDKAKVYLRRLAEKYPKRLFSCLAPLSVIILLGLFVLGAVFNLKSLNVRDFSFFTASSSQSLFISSVRNFLIESPEMSIINGNSMIGLSPPATVATQTLGTMLGGIESTELESEGEIFEYLVEQGDTLSSVAEKFDISLDTILWANDLTSRSVIKPGQKIIVLPVSGTLHLVQSGDTISGLAKTYKANVDEIVAFNNLSGKGDIFIGDVLIVPGGTMPVRAPRITSIPLAESYFIFPTEGRISRGPHGAFGNAVDVANKCGKIVVASAGGTVQRAGPIPVGGNRITILHPNEVVTYYGHLSAITVAPGQTVTAGQVIGYIGNTGFTVGATGCHLHFEVRGARNFLKSYRAGANISW